VSSQRAVGEHERDQQESDFTSLLRGLLRGHPAIVAAAFVDGEGECVDYCSRVEPFEAKVAGAHLQIVTEEVRPRVAVLGGGELVQFEVYGDARDHVVRRLDEQYVMVVVVLAGHAEAGMLEDIERVARALRREAGIEAPSWDPQAGPIEVQTRRAVGWSYAPVAFRQGNARTEIAAVLGRWTERGRAAGGELVCFRVRTRAGIELTLAYDASQGKWLRW
jgi:hypothetical protein